MYAIKKFQLLNLFFLFLNINLYICNDLQPICIKNDECYGTSLCSTNKYPTNKIKPRTLSNETCFVKNIQFKMGTDYPVFVKDGESPARIVKLKNFCIDQTEVSNLQFYQFVQETNYKTEAEKFGDSFCLVNLLSENVKKTIEKKSAEVPWWVVVKNTSWFNPEGIDSNIFKRWNHPVIHVSWNDANAYCRYFNKRLPTEEEWEYSCKGDLEERMYPWGNNDLPKGEHMMNIWQGNFPESNTAEDGFQSTAPVNSFNQNRFNMKNIVGNVWEWTDDWWEIDHKNFNKPKDAKSSGNNKVKKGGSFMCSKSFCHRYRCAARNKNTPDTSASNIGFRCARSI